MLQFHPVVNIQSQYWRPLSMLEYAQLEKIKDYTEEEEKKASTLSTLYYFI